jgi:hypothetical protein
MGTHNASAGSLIIFDKGRELLNPFRFQLSRVQVQFAYLFMYVCTYHVSILY